MNGTSKTQVYRIIECKKMCLLLLIVVCPMLWAANNSQQDDSEFSYALYAKALKAYVNDQGWVNYSGLKADSTKLDAFCLTLEKVDPAVFKKWDDKKKIVFWVNAYNALTLKTIIDNYPIKSSFWRSLKYPKRSIRQIPGVWDKLQFVVMGKNITLGDIEHKKLRAEFDEPRIHMALVCAAKGCPPLRNTPYVADKLDEQLGDQAKRFLNNPSNFKLDRRKNKVYISSIFEWFDEDFTNKYAPAAGFSHYNEAERAVLNFISEHLAEDKAEYLKTKKYKIIYLKYDWSLNEYKKPAQPK